MINATLLTIAATASLVLATPVLAHPGHDEGLGLLHGFAHPLGGGIDPVFTLIAIGLVVAAVCGSRLLLLLRR